MEHLLRVPAHLTRRHRADRGPSDLKGGRGRSVRQLASHARQALARASCGPLPDASVRPMRNLPRPPTFDVGGCRSGSRRGGRRRATIHTPCSACRAAIRGSSIPTSVGPSASTADVDATDGPRRRSSRRATRTTGRSRLEMISLLQTGSGQADEAAGWSSLWEIGPLPRTARSDRVVRSDQRRGACRRLSSRGSAGSSSNHTFVRSSSTSTPQSFASMSTSISPHP